MNNNLQDTIAYEETVEPIHTLYVALPGDALIVQG
jgi:hypothetical protein